MLWERGAPDSASGCERKHKTAVIKGGFNYSGVV